MNLPSWALRKATISDWKMAKQAHEKMAVRILFNNRSILNSWMKKWGWKRSWFFPEESFYKQLFESEENYRMALSERFVEIFIPVTTYQITDRQLKEMDDDYDSRSFSILVERLREIRRTIEAGVVVEVDKKTLKSWNAFYTWAHSRYYLLEEGSDKWIGDDR